VGEPFGPKRLRAALWERGLATAQAATLSGIGAGGHVSWDDARKDRAPSAVGLYPVAIATEAAGSGATTVKVRLDGIATQAA